MIAINNLIPMFKIFQIMLIAKEVDYDMNFCTYNTTLLDGKYIWFFFHESTSK